MSVQAGALLMRPSSVRRGLALEQVLPEASSPRPISAGEPALRQRRAGSVVAEALPEQPEQAQTHRSVARLRPEAPAAHFPRRQTAHLAPAMARSEPLQQEPWPEAAPLPVPRGRPRSERGPASGEVWLEPALPPTKQWASPAVARAEGAAMSPCQRVPEKHSAMMDPRLAPRPPYVARWSCRRSVHRRCLPSPHDPARAASEARLRDWDKAGPRPGVGGAAGRSRRPEDCATSSRGSSKTELTSNRIAKPLRRPKRGQLEPALPRP